MHDTLQLKEAVTDLGISFDTSVKPEEIQSPFTFKDTSNLLDLYTSVVLGITEELSSMNSYVLKGTTVGAFAVHTKTYVDTYLSAFIDKLSNTLKTDNITLSKSTKDLPWNTSMLEIVENKSSLLEHEIRDASELRVLTSKAKRLLESYSASITEFSKHVSNCEASEFTEVTLRRFTTQVVSDDAKDIVDKLSVGMKELSIINATFIEVFQVVHELIHQVISPIWENSNVNVQSFNSPEQVNFTRLTKTFVDRAETDYNKKLSFGLESLKVVNLLKEKANSKTSPDIKADLNKATANSRDDRNYLFNTTRASIDMQKDALKKLDTLAATYEKKSVDIQERFVRSRYGDKYIGSKELKARVSSLKTNWEQLIKLQDLSNTFLTGQLKLETVDSKAVETFKKSFNTQLKAFGKTITLGLLQTSSKPEEFAWWDWSPIPSSYPSTSEVPASVKEIREAIALSEKALDEFVKYNADLYRKFYDMTDEYVKVQDGLSPDSDKFEFIFPMVHALSKTYYYMTSLLYGITTYLTYYPTGNIAGVESFGSDMDNVLGDSTTEDEEVKSLEPETEGSPLTEEIYTKESDDPEVEPGTEGFIKNWKDKRQRKKELEENEK